jgi:hypothetical protein
VHFSVLQEYMAARLCMEMGVYTHISDSWHFYLENPTWKKLSDGDVAGAQDYYTGHAPSRLSSLAIVNGSVQAWDDDLKVFFSDEWDDTTLYQDVFFSGVARTMRDAWSCYKRGDFVSAIHLSKNIRAQDWALACTQWLQRRKTDGQV